MASHYVKEENRKNAYVTRARSIPIKRISEPIEEEFTNYRSLKLMCKELHLSIFKARKFIESGDDACYLRSSKTGALYMMLKPVKDCVATARIVDETNEDAPEYQEFTSFYQLSKRFRLSLATIAERRKLQPVGVECTKPVKDEFDRYYYLTFNK